MDNDDGIIIYFDDPKIVRTISNSYLVDHELPANIRSPSGDCKIFLPVFASSFP